MKLIKHILNRYLTFCVFTVFMLISIISNATHNRAGEIICKNIGGFTYQITVITYTKESSSSADRCNLEIDYGDGSAIDTIYRTNGPSGNPCQHYGEIIANDVKKNIYITTHTYKGGFGYIISVEDPNRNAEVVNIPGSIDVVFYIETYLKLSPFLGSNNSPTLLNPPIDDACVCKPYIHNPGAYDVDGDSLSYRLVSCKGLNGVDIGGYYIPTGASINAITGDFTWPCPGASGEYNFAILIEEWKRIGDETFLVGSVLRDMQITVRSCTNNPPKIDALRDTCVIAGSTLTFNVRATDQDVNELVTLSSTGAPYLVNTNRASFNDALPANPVNSTFEWKTICEHVKLNPYTVYFKAIDDNVNPLVDFKSINITVIAPKTPNLQAQAIGTNINLSWSPNPCSEATGYKLYRRNGANPYTPDNCETGIPAYRGYTLIKTINGYTNTTYTDNNNGSGMQSGTEYCYRVVATFNDGSESIVSDEICISLRRDIPIITNASVVATDDENGIIYIAWSKPIDNVLTGLDTTMYGGSYGFKLWHSTDMATWQEILNTNSQFFGNLNDTTFTQDSLNTQLQTNYFKVEFYAQNTQQIGTTQVAPNIFLSLVPNDNRLTLNWNNSQPWTNYKYRIYKQNAAGNFNLLDSTSATTYTDYNLINGKTYCYYIEAYGEYSVSGVSKPLINLSQIACSEPKDLTAPCPPTLYTLKGNCDDFNNELYWNMPKIDCADDVVKYNIYRTPTQNGTFELAGSNESNADTTFYLDSLFTSIAGCYYVTAIDTFNNESLSSDTLCVDNCPYYELPNIFTPNNDKQNDFFEPLPKWKFIESIDLKIFNRWGALVYTTTDPAILWDGLNNVSNQYCPDGVYYYICKINEIHLKGIVSREVSGYAHMYRQNNPPSK